jgi:hypothetical protein
MSDSALQSTNLPERTQAFHASVGLTALTMTIEAEREGLHKPMGIERKRRWVVTSTMRVVALL